VEIRYIPYTLDVFQMSDGHSAPADRGFHADVPQKGGRIQHEFKGGFDGGTECRSIGNENATAGDSPLYWHQDSIAVEPSSRKACVDKIPLKAWIPSKASDPCGQRSNRLLSLRKFGFPPVRCVSPASIRYSHWLLRTHGVSQ
jgi:hypothetical protein